MKTTTATESDIQSKEPMTELTVPIHVIERLHREAEELYLCQRGLEPVHGYHRIENDLNGDGVNSVTFRLYTAKEVAYLRALSGSGESG